METPVSYAKHHKYIFGTLLVLVILVTAIGSRFMGKKNQQAEVNQLSTVTLVSAQDYLKDRGQISANGMVESLEQAELRSQASGPVTKINVQIGQQVRSGQVLVTLQNNDISAQIAQAQAVLKSQQARLDEMRKGARNEQILLEEAKLNAAKQGLTDTKAQQDVLVKSAYTSLLNAGLTAKAGSGNSGSGNPTVSGSYTGTQQGEYVVTLYAANDGMHYKVTGLENYSGLINSTPQSLGSQGLFIQFPSANLNANDTWTISIPNTQAPTYTALNSAYQAAVQGRETAVNGAQSGLNAEQKAYDLLVAGATNDQIRQQEAAVDQASAAVAAASAQYDKTVIKSPIDGTVASLPVKYGELVSPGALVASVVNKGGQQVKAYISDYDLPFVEEGAEVAIGDKATGTLARLSPSIDPQTKNVEVQVVVTDPAVAGLVVGQNVALKISTKQSSGSGPVFLLPLQAVKVSGGGASVLTVKDGSIIEERPVELGSVSGENVEVKSGLTPDMQIISAVYDLKAGQKVNVE